MIIKIADVMVSVECQDVESGYVLIEDSCLLKERMNSKLVQDPTLFSGYDMPSIIKLSGSISNGNMNRA